MESPTEAVSTDRRLSTGSILKPNIFDLQIKITEKSLNNDKENLDKLESHVDVVDKLEALDKVESDLDFKVEEVPGNYTSRTSTKLLPGIDSSENKFLDSTESETNVDTSREDAAKANNSVKLDDPTNFLMSSFNEKKRNYFDKHNLSNEYEKVTDDSDSLFLIKNKQKLIKTFKFNANSKAFIKNLKFNYSEETIQNNTNLQQAKMAFYDTLLNKGGNNLNNKYLKALNSARFTSKSYSKFENDYTQSNANLNNFYTNTDENLSTMKSAKSNRLPGLKGRGNNGLLMDTKKMRAPRDNLLVTNKPDGITEPEIKPDFRKRREASEYYNNKVRLIAKLIHKHNKQTEEGDKPNKKKSIESAKSRKTKNRNDENDNFNTHFTASFPSHHQTQNNHLLNGLNPFKTTKLDRQFKRIIHIDHNKRFNSKSSSQMGESSSQINGEKPIDSKQVNHLPDRSVMKLSSIVNKRSVPSGSNKTNNNSMVKIKFPSINKNTARDYPTEKDNIFASSSFVKTDSSYKDTIKS